MTVMTLYVVRMAEDLWLKPDQTQMFSFGEFYSLYDNRANYTVWELALFVLLGSMGGLIGAAYNDTNAKLQRWREKRVRKSRHKVVEVVIVAIAVSLVSYIVPRLWGQCTPRPVDMESFTEQEKQLVDDLVSFNCPPDQYNQVASLYFTEADTAIKQLFHFREGGEADVQTFSSGALFVFFLPYICLACWTYGLGVPSGLFVPCLLSGAAFGRLFGHLLHKLDNASGTFADSGTYALMGAAAVLGGMARMTISLTVILLEATGDMQYVLPLMVTLMAARWIGYVFNDSLYDICIEAKHLPFLEEELPPFVKKNDAIAGQVMSPGVHCLRPVERVGRILDLLLSTPHHCFPIVEQPPGTLSPTGPGKDKRAGERQAGMGGGGRGPKERDEGEEPSNYNQGLLVGSILRKALAVILQQRAFAPPGADPTSSNRVSPLLHWGILERIYPRYPRAEDLHISAEERECWVDLRPYCNDAPYTIHVGASVERTYRFFRTLGLRHLVVTNKHNQVVGMITRNDLTAENMIERLQNVPKKQVWENHSIKLTTVEE
eukprot:CAMPEP_0113953446 /NCGR_PEP_ID=MMETSP1339-20121228/90980_1 /TAXON_ID=94617 /ORGANISM="Fibrocapsa japonica" /LENGTH=546 /DNA_ID=CAMNT_0000962177 /DNA_START=23 /DNA_END=1664 /DNA_ORIENTATION=- /assembly_acc=CAM_ASM_000762